MNSSNTSLLNSLLRASESGSPLLTLASSIALATPTGMSPAEVVSSTPSSLDSLRTAIFFLMTLTREGSEEKKLGQSAPYWFSARIAIWASSLANPFPIASVLSSRDLSPANPAAKSDSLRFLDVATRFPFSTLNPFPRYFAAASSTVLVIAAEILLPTFSSALTRAEEAEALRFSASIFAFSSSAAFFALASSLAFADDSRSALTDLESFSRFALALADSASGISNPSLNARLTAIFTNSDPCSPLTPISLALAA